MIRRIAVRETSVSHHPGVQLRAPQEPLEPSKIIAIRGLGRGALIMPQLYREMSVSWTAIRLIAVRFFQTPTFGSWPNNFLNF